MKALWKVPASLFVISIAFLIFLVLLIPCMVLTLIWFPLVMGGAIDISREPPMFWPIDLVMAVFDWWIDV